jgi:hypothetical protein
MNLCDAINQAIGKDVWVKHPNGNYFMVGYLAHYASEPKLSPVPVDSETLHCIPVSRRDGTLMLTSIGTSDRSLDVKFDANDLLVDYELVTSDYEKGKIVYDYNVEINNNRNNFFNDMPTNIRDSFDSIYGESK